MVNRSLFFKYNIYNNFIKKGRKTYFLLDFFMGLKGSFIYKNLNKNYTKYESLLYNSFSNFNLLNNKNFFDYFFSNFDINSIPLFISLKNEKKKENIFFVSLINQGFFYSIYLRHIWLLNNFFCLNINYINHILAKQFINYKYFFIFYDCIKIKLIKNIFINIKKNLFIKLNIKLYNHKFYLFNDFFLLLNFNKLKHNVNFYYINKSKYNILYINKIYKKFNKYVYLSKQFFNIKPFYKNTLCNVNDIYYSNKLQNFINNKKLNVKYKFNLFFEKKLNKNKKKALIKLHTFINYFSQLYLNQYLNSNKKQNIVLKQYFYFYSYIMKIFIKLLNNFKFVLFDKFNKNNSIIFKLIWIRIFLIFLYYKKFVIFKKKRISKINFLIDNLKLKKDLLKVNKINFYFKYFMKNLPEWRKKIVNEKIKKFKINLQLRLKYIKLIRVYKNGKDFIFFNLFKLRKIYLRLKYKIKRMQKYKKKGTLKKYKLMYFIKRNNLKKHYILRLLGLI
jgi:hypothetical protein